MRGWTGNTTGKRAASSTSASTIRASRRVVDVGRAVQRDERVLAGASTPRSQARRRRACAPQRRSESIIVLPTWWMRPSTTPSARRFSTASGLCVKRRSDRRSVRTRLISSGMPQSKERRPASTCATGMPCLAAASAQPSVELTSPATTTADRPLLDAGPARSRSGPWPSARRARRSRRQEAVGRREVEVGQDLVRHLGVVVLAGVHDDLPERARRRSSAVMTGAIFTKFGRAPTTCTIVSRCAVTRGPAKRLRDVRGRPRAASGWCGCRRA